jgi:hypothetical protein
VPSGSGTGRDLGQSENKASFSPQGAFILLELVNQKPAKEYRITVQECEMSGRK